MKRTTINGVIVIALAASIIALCRHREETIRSRPRAMSDVHRSTGELVRSGMGLAVQKKPQPGAPRSAPTRTDRYETAKEISVTVSGPDAKGVFTRERLIRTSGKYPLLRVEDRMNADPRKGTASLLSQRAMAADHIIVKLRPGVPAGKLDGILAAVGGRIHKKIGRSGTWLVAFPNPTLQTVPEKIKALGAYTNLISVAEPNHIVYAFETPNDPSFGSLWGMDRINATGAWDVATQATGIVVGVIDTGIDIDHPDLVANLWVNPGEIPGNSIDDDLNGFVDDIHGYDFHDDDGSPDDGLGHGTHVSGTIGAAGNNGVGVVGVCWSTRIMTLRFLGNDGSGAISDAIAALDYAVMMHERGVPVKLTNNSWGDRYQPGTYNQSMWDAIEESKNAGMLFVAAAGNNGLNNDALPSYPASYNNSNIICVANTTSNDTRSSGSNYGVQSVDIGAPGGDFGTQIYSTIIGGYGEKYGTSMAAPHVSGVAALLWSTMPELTWQHVQNAIYEGGDTIGAMQGVTSTGKRLNALGALEQVPPWIDHEPLLNTTNTVEPYWIETVIEPAALIATNTAMVLWNTSGSTNGFTTNVLSLVSNNVFSAAISNQSVGTTIHYMITAEAENGLVSTLPTNAPADLLDFDVAVAKTLLVIGDHEGDSVEIGTVSPDYGLHIYPAGYEVAATAQLLVSETNDHRYACTGWNGVGSIDDGTSNAVTFDIEGSSTIEWLWESQFTLSQTSAIPGLVTTSTWWSAAASGTTVEAETMWTDGSTNYMFTEWHVDGMRHPAATNSSPNPATGISMSTSRMAVAFYMDASIDSDADGLDDWWEQRYFGSPIAVPTEDHDGDGYLNHSEAADHTDPWNSNSVPTGPTISHTPAPDPMPTPSPWTIRADVTDNDAVDEVDLRWRRNGQGWSVTAMTTSAVPNEYTAAIPSPHILGDTYDYRIDATDRASNLSESDTFSFSVAYPLSSATPTNVDLVVLAGTISNIWVSITNAGNTDLVWQAHAEWRDGFDDATNGWSHYGANDTWNRSTYRSYSPPSAWYCGNDATHLYGNLMDAALESPDMMLGPSAELTFMHWMDVEWDDEQLDDHYWDGGIVEVSTNGGVEFVKIFPEGGYPHRVTRNVDSPFEPDSPIYGGDGTWEHARFDLSAYAGQVARIRFRFGADTFTFEEGWYIDDVAIMGASDLPYWLAPDTTNGIIAHSNGGSFPLSLNATTFATGDQTSTLRILSDDPLLYTNLIPVRMRVRSIPEVGALTGQQTSTNGEGIVILSNTVFDADNEMCALHVDVSTDMGGSWTSAWIHAAVASLGAPTVTNPGPMQVSNIVTTNENPGATNLLAVSWATTNGPLAGLLNTSVLARARAWDGMFWSASTTSTPFMVDNQPPTPPGSFSSDTHEPATWSSNGTIRLLWDAASDGNGIGIRSYHAFVAEGLPSPQQHPVQSTTGLTVSVDIPTDGSNWWTAIAAVDLFGNVSALTDAGAFQIDRTAPTSTGAVLHISTSPFGDYVVGTTVPSTWSGFSDAHSGISNYYVSFADGGGTTNGLLTMQTSATLAAALANQTNRVFVWAQDAVGSIGQPISEPVLVLSVTEDHDHDGLANGDEEIAGTDANDPESILSLLSSLSFTGAPPGAIVFNWAGITGRTYAIVSRDTLGSSSSTWQGVSGATNLPGIDGAMSATNSIESAPGAFYRLNVSQP